MSIWPATDPACSSCPPTPAIATIIDASPRDIDGFKAEPDFSARAARRPPNPPPMITTCFLMIDPSSLVVATPRSAFPVSTPGSESISSTHE
jgi:hypothetical protein